MNNIKFINQSSCTNTINDEILVKINGEKIVEYKDFNLEDGRYTIEVEQMHLYNNKFFVFFALFTLLDLIINTVDAGYLPRRFGRYAYCKFDVIINKNEKFYINMSKKTKFLIYDKYLLNIQSKVKNEKINHSYKTNCFTILGTLCFWLILALLVLIIVLFIKWSS